MKVDFKDYITSHCKYCVNYQKVNQSECIQCTKANDYYAMPTCFSTEMVIAQEYFRLLQDYSKMLFCMGFEVR